MKRYVIYYMKGNFFEWVDAEFAFEQHTQAHMKAGALATELVKYTCVKDLLYGRILAVYTEKGLVV